MPGGLPRRTARCRRPLRSSVDDREELGAREAGQLLVAPVTAELADLVADAGPGEQLRLRREQADVLEEVAQRVVVLVGRRPEHLFHGVLIVGLEVLARDRGVHLLEPAVVELPRLLEPRLDAL